MLQKHGVFSSTKTAVDYLKLPSEMFWEVLLFRFGFVFFFFQGPNNEILFLELDLLETTCHILNPTPLVNCSVRTFAEHVSI